MLIDDFNRLADRTRLKSRARSWAEAVLVHNKTVSYVYKSEGVSYQAVKKAVNRVKKEIKDKCPLCGPV